MILCIMSRIKLKIAFFKNDLLADTKTFPPMLPLSSIYQAPIRVIIDIIILLTGIIFLLPVM
jgi:hypothetical protein